MNPFYFFNIIYCINLDNRIDRWEQCQKEFSKLGILDRVIRFSAHKENYTSDPKRNACIGNHLSHADCIYKSIENEDNNCLIFEDDVEFFLPPEQTLDILSKSISELPNDWDMLYLGCNMDAFIAYQETEHLAKLTGAFATHAYAVRRTLFTELNNLNRRIDVIHNDVSYAYEVIPNYKVYQTIPMLCGQRDSWSDIERNTSSNSKMMLERFQQKLIRR